MPELPADLAKQVEAALREDLGSGDVTAALVPAAQRVRSVSVELDKNTSFKDGARHGLYRELGTDPLSV